MFHITNWQKGDIKMRKLNFESDNLIADYISLNIKGLKDPKIIGIYLSKKFGFNSIVKKTKNGNFECLIDKAENRFQVSFKQYVYNPESKNFWGTFRTIIQLIFIVLSKGKG